MTKIFYKEIKSCEDCPCAVMQQKWDEYYFCTDLEVALTGLDDGEYYIHPDCRLEDKDHYYSIY